MSEDQLIVCYFFTVVERHPVRVLLAFVHRDLALPQSECDKVDGETLKVYWRSFLR